MKPTIIIATIALLSANIFAAETNLTAEQAEAKYTQAIEGRTADTNLCDSGQTQLGKNEAG